MSQRQDEAYVLDTMALGEADLIVTLLAEHAGRVRGVAASARKSRRRFGGALDPLTRVRASWSERGGRDLHRIESLDLERSFAAMQADPATQAACAVVAEILAAVTREGEGDSRGFRLLGAVLDALEHGLDPWVAVRYFEYWTLRLHGVLPDCSACSACGVALAPDAPHWVSEREAVRCADCVRSAGTPHRVLGRADCGFLRAIASSPPATLRDWTRTAGPGGAVETLLRGALESFVERSFRTYRHLGSATAKPGGARRSTR